MSGTFSGHEKIFITSKYHYPIYDHGTMEKFLEGKIWEWLDTINGGKAETSDSYISGQSFFISFKGT